MDHRAGPSAGLSQGVAGPGAFADDDGSVPGPVAAVLARRAEGRAWLSDLVPVLARHRLLVPLLEVEGDLLEGDDADPCAGQDRAVAAVSVRTDEGTVGLAFTGLPALAQWDPAARPMPVESTRVAAALLAEGGIGLVIDAAGPLPVRLSGPALRRLATGEPWPPPWQDVAVRDAVAVELAPAVQSGDLAVRLAAPGAEQGAELVVELRFAPGLPAELAADRSRLVAERLAACASLRAVFDGVLAVRLV
ncbi:MAG TPA: SseB family protein [Candidatus Nanopelagicales bacterium]